MNRYLEMKETLLRDIPAEVREKLSKAESDVQVCQILADNGINLEKMEHTIESFGFDLKKIGLQLPDQYLGAVAGGFHDDDYDFDVACTCGNNDKNNFSRQFWASLLCGPKSIYRCKNCSKYIHIWAHNHIQYMTKEEYNDSLW